MRVEDVPTQVRSGSMPVSVYNEGLAIFLCDASFEAEIEDFVAGLEGELPSEEPADQKNYQPLTDAGKLLTYELYQDDPVLIHFALGEPATKAEEKLVPLVKPLRGFLVLPTGELKIHSVNTAAWCDADGEDRPGTLQVPPGEYVVTVRHIDFDALTEVIDEEDPELELPDQFVTLTPFSEVSPLKKKLAFLEYPVD